MFLLSNINNKDHKKAFPEESDVIFDISAKKLSSSKNSAWHELSVGSVVCVVKSTRKVSTFYTVTSIKGLGDSESKDGETFILSGVITAKLVPEFDMRLLFDKLEVEHKSLPSNKFSSGFNIADLGVSLDSLEVKTSSGPKTIGKLKESA